MNILDHRELNKVANNKVAADQAYHEAWMTARETTIRLPVDRFWSIMATFRSNILNVDRHNVSKYTCDELFRCCVTNNLVVNSLPVTFDELVSFIENWEAVTAALHETLFDIVSGKGDDGYSDLCDSLPLIGRRGVSFLLSLKNTANNDIVTRAIKNNRPADCIPSAWLKLIWEGENYWRMYLGNEAKGRYPRQAANHTLKSETLV